MVRPATREREAGSRHTTQQAALELVLASGRSAVVLYLSERVQSSGRAVRATEARGDLEGEALVSSRA